MESDNLIKAIVADPTDDFCRLVYADWCEENGDPARAEFIRAQIEMYRLHPDRDTQPWDWDEPRYKPLQEAAEMHWDAHAEHWYPRLTRIAETVRTERGFPCSAELSVKRFVRRGEYLFRIAPTLTDFTLRGTAGDLETLAGCPALACVRELTLKTSFRAQNAEVFFASSHLSNLRSLNLAHTKRQMGDRGLRALGRSPSLKALESLDLHGQALSDEGLRDLPAADWLDALRNLGLSNNLLADDTARALARATRLRRLTSLDLGLNQFSALGLQALGEAPHLEGLQELSLLCNREPLGVVGMQALAQAVFLPQLRHLSLLGCGLEDEALATILHANLPRLVGLLIADNDLGGRSVSALAGNASLGSVAALDLDAPTPDWAEQLGRMASLPGLHELTLHGSLLAPEALQGLLAGPLLSPVRKLNLNRLGLGDRGAEILASAKPLPELRELLLSENNITDRGVQALVRSEGLAGVRWMVLTENPVGDAGRAAIADRFGWYADYLVDDPE
jgi:uncharacterized protein (TIGR02996 family)